MAETVRINKDVMSHCDTSQDTGFMILNKVSFDLNLFII